MTEYLNVALKAQTHSYFSQNAIFFVSAAVISKVNLIKITCNFLARVYKLKLKVYLTQHMLHIEKRTMVTRFVYEMKYLETLCLGGFFFSLRN